MDRQRAEILLGAKWPQSSLASTATLRDAGISESLLTAGVRSGAILRLRRGAYYPARRWSVLKPWEQDAARVEAHIEGTNGSATYCLSSAAILHGCAVWNVGPEVHVATGYSGATVSRGPDTRSHQLGLAEADVVTVERRGRKVRVTSVERTLADCFRFLPHEQAVVIGDSALHLRLVEPGAVGEIIAKGSPRGRRRALAVMEVLEPGTESPGESRTRVLLAKLGFGKPVAQLTIYTTDGVYRADFAWPDLKVIIEFDGDGKYMDFEPTAAVLLAERRREALLMELGWIFVRLRWADLDRPDEVRRRVDAAIARAARFSA